MKYIDLPAPLGPSKPHTVFFWIFKFSFSTICLLPYEIVKFLSSITGLSSLNDLILNFLINNSYFETNLLFR